MKKPRLRRQRRAPSKKRWPVESCRISLDESGMINNRPGGGKHGLQISLFNAEVEPRTANVLPENSFVVFTLPAACS